MEMNARDKQERDRRDDERRQEDLRREERREKRELEYRAQAEQREAKMILALKESQNVPHDIHVENSKLPSMSKGEEVDSFIEFFESALLVAKVPKDKWLEKLHPALDSATKVLVKETITRPGVTYEEVKQALIGQTHLSFSAASEAIDTLDDHRVEKLPERQAILSVAKLFKQVTTDATSDDEIHIYSAIATCRCSFNPDLKQYLDLKGTFDLDGVCKAIGEWKRSHLGMSMWEFRTKRPVDRQVVRSSQPHGKRTGECYSCGKPGHFAQECRSRLYKERQPAQQGSSEGQVVKKELGLEKPLQKRDLSEVTCYTCRQKGHMSPKCFKRTSKVKRVKVCEDQVVSLRRNEIFGAVGPHRMPVTCDTGAEVTVVPEECVEPHQKTGESCVLRSFNDTKTTGECCVVTITVGKSTFTKKAVTQPGVDLGWSVCLSLDMTDPEESQFLLREMQR